MNYISDFADQAVILPVAGIVLICVVLLGWWQAAGAWLLGVGGVLSAMIFLKYGLVILAGMFGSEYMSSPSGHVAAACVIYGGMSLLLFQGVVPAAVLALVPVLLAAFVGYIRVALGAHTMGEVLAGAIVGCLGYAAMAAMIGRRPRLATWPVAAAGGCTMLALHGMHMPAEAAIRFAASGW